MANNVKGVISDKELDDVLSKLFAIKHMFSREDFHKVIGEAAKPAEDAMKQAAPVRSGRLQKSIQTFRAKKQKSSVALVGAILSAKSKVKSVKGIKRISRRKNAYYAAIVNTGGQRGFERSGFVNVPPNRFVERAATSSKSAVAAKLKEGAIKYAKKEIKDIFK